ncbi:hypothetical protein AgCh_035579 [Apium graveolens]
MSWSAKTISDWKEARDKRSAQLVSKSPVIISSTIKWKKPDYEIFKLNVDATIKLGDISFSVGIVLRDHSGTLVLGKTICKPMVSSIFEAEALAIFEGLRWLISMSLDKMVIESDSFLLLKALQNSQESLLESCRAFNIRIPIIMTEVSPDSEIEGYHHLSIEMPQQSYTRRARPRPRKPSSFYLSEEQRENYLRICVPLYNAALDGDWHAAEEIIKDCPEVINMSITKKEDTLLHVVSSTKHTHFAQKVVNKMTDLELKNRDGKQLSV